MTSAFSLRKSVTFESIMAVLINMVETLMMSAKLATLGLLEIMVLRNKVMRS